MIKLKLQYFGHLMQRVDSLEKTLMLGGIRGTRRRGRRRVRWLDGITHSMDMSFSEIRELVMAREALHDAISIKISSSSENLFSPISCLSIMPWRAFFIFLLEFFFSHLFLFEWTCTCQLWTSHTLLGFFAPLPRDTVCTLGCIWYVFSFIWKAKRT